MSLRALIAYDGSATASTAVRATAALFPGAQATVATASETFLPRSTTPTVPSISPETVQRTIDALAAQARRGAERIAQEGVEQALALGLEAEARAAVRGGTAAALLELAHGQAADVLVCGTRGRAALSRALLGSTSTRLLHDADLPLLVVPDDAGTLDGPAVLAYDGSAPAQWAIDAAGRLLSGRRTVVLHVWESQYHRSLAAEALERGPVDEVREIVAVLEQALEEDAQALSEDGVERARAAGLDAVGETLESDSGVWRVIASTAREHEAAVVVAGARGIGGARSALLGSVSSGLVHNAGAPVLVVPPEAA